MFSISDWVQSRYQFDKGFKVFVMKGLEDSKYLTLNVMGENISSKMTLDNFVFKNNLTS